MYTLQAANIHFAAANMNFAHETLPFKLQATLRQFCDEKKKKKKKKKTLLRQ